MMINAIKKISITNTLKRNTEINLINIKRKYFEIITFYKLKKLIYFYFFIYY